MRSIHFAAKLILIFSLPLLAQAQSEDEGIYIGVAAGVTHSSQGIRTAQSDQSDRGYRFSLGYQFTPHFALETAYTDLGKLSGTYNATLANTPTRVTVDNAFKNVSEVNVVGNVPLSEKVDGFGRLGVYNAKSELSGSALGTTIRLDGTDKKTTNAVYGLGLKYIINPKLSLQGEIASYSNMNIAGTEDKTNMNLYSVGVHYKF
jgi:Outer membrane protein beta-barrel domain